MWRRLFVFYCSCLALINHANAQSSPSGIRIQKMEVFGSGCPTGSYSANISPDGQTFSLLLDNFVSESSMQHPISRLLCELKVNFFVPRGWTFTIISADYRGFAYAEPGSYVAHQALYSFDGSKPRNEKPGYENGRSYAFRSQEFHGPYNDIYYIHHDLDHRLAPWAPCNNSDSQTLFLTTFLMARNLNLSSDIKSQIALDSIDGQVQSQRYKLIWKTCAPENRPRNPGRPPRYPFIQAR